MPARAAAAAAAGGIGTLCAQQQLRLTVTEVYMVRCNGVHERAREPVTCEERVRKRDSERARYREIGRKR